MTIPYFLQTGLNGFEHYLKHKDQLFVCLFTFTHISKLPVLSCTVYKQTCTNKHTLKIEVISTFMGQRFSSKTCMALNETLIYIYTLVPFFTRISQLCLKYVRQAIYQTFHQQLVLISLSLKKLIIDVNY